jgi:hypothetical protein
MKRGPPGSDWWCVSFCPIIERSRAVQSSVSAWMAYFPGSWNPAGSPMRLTDREARTEWGQVRADALPESPSDTLFALSLAPHMR